MIRAALDYFNNLSGGVKLIAGGLLLAVLIGGALKVESCRSGRADRASDEQDAEAQRVNAELQRKVDQLEGRDIERAEQVQAVQREQQKQHEAIQLLAQKATAEDARIQTSRGKVGAARSGRGPVARTPDELDGRLRELYPEAEAQ